MLILVLIFLLLLLGVLIFTVFKIIKWTLKEKIRIIGVFSIICILVFASAIKKMFFTNMEFIQSNVYSNLYIVENPIKDKEVQNKAIVEKIKEHLKTKHKQTKELSYSDTKSIYFYEDGGSTFGFVGEAGTSYFIDHEEDLGGFVTEELAMYQDYRLAEFNYKTCANDTTKFCGKLAYYYKGKIIKSGIFKFN